MYIVTDEQLAKLVVERVRKEDCVSNGFVLDGFPVNKAQAVALEQGGVKLNR